MSYRHNFMKAEVHQTSIDLSHLFNIIGQLIAVHPTGLEVDATDDSVTLQCTATNEGEISHWLLNGARLDPASLSGVDVTTTAGAGGSSTLSISSYQPAVHAGEYRCVARLLEGEMLMEVSHAAPVSHFSKSLCYTITHSNTEFIKRILLKINIFCFLKMIAHLIASLEKVECACYIILFQEGSSVIR